MDSTSVPLPFHVSIREELTHCQRPDSVGLRDISYVLRLLQLIKQTIIPTGHEDIINTIRWYFDFPGGLQWEQEVSEVVAHLSDQRRLALGLVDTKGKFDRLITAVMANRQPVDDWSEDRPDIIDA